ncbi:MAG: hypothetical protein H6P98_1538, partial [Candidatus Aminicenantes bacterium]|nr:hypothetical protein [Candidatus Aminicenantes bacterium]
MARLATRLENDRGAPYSCPCSRREPS